VDKKRKLIIGALIAVLAGFGVSNGMKKKKGDTEEPGNGNTGNTPVEMTLAAKSLPAFNASIMLPENAKESSKSEAHVHYSAEGGAVATGAKVFKVIWAGGCTLDDEAAVRRNASDYNMSGTIKSIAAAEDGSYTVDFEPQGIMYTRIRFAKIGDCHVGAVCDGANANKANIDAICDSLKASN
tara:strand:+ start:2385 stop:2933 length:549 start_codon:yes stop_codon:yes gene_type:complete